MQKFTDIVLAASGGGTASPLGNATVTVTQAIGGATAAIYSDNGVTPLANPFTADNTGRVSFYAADGRYTITVAKTGFTTVTIADIILEDSQDTLTFTDTGTLGAWQSTTNSYNQLMIQNKSNGSTASASYVFNNDVATTSTNYGEVGINSSGYSGTGPFNQPGYCYVASATTPLAIGTYSNQPIYFVVNSGATAAATIDTSNRLLVPNGTVVAPVAFASLPASPIAGQRAMINNSVAAPAFLSTAAGGGSTTVPVFYNGTAWLVG